jgi:cytochrome c-type biogenesis protein CcsB
MLKKLSFLISMPFMAVLMIVLIVVLALATFMESAYNTQTAYAVFYGSHWFELLLLVIGINLVGVVVKQKLYKRKKIVVFLFHIAFIIILLGAAITRFISFEGNMHIRENMSSNTMLSSSAYIDIALESKGESVETSKEVRLTDFTPRDYRMSTRIGGEKVKVKSTEYMSNATEQYMASPGGSPYLQLMIVTDRQNTVGIPSGRTQEVMGMRVALNNADTTAMLNFISEGEQVFLYAAMEVTEMKMGGEEGEVYQPGDKVSVKANTLYSVGHMRLAMQNFMPSARRQLVRAQAGQRGGMGAVRLEVKYKGMTTDLFVPGLARVKGQPVSGTMGDLTYTITYGSREILVPFSLFLKDFEVERYPGSNSPSSFASDVVLLDPEMGIQEERRIYMNNVLKHRGYRFYQASYDTDEMGSVLSVNKDWVGTFVTYLGYLVLIAGMVVALFVPGTRFAMMAKKSAPAAKAALIALLILGGSMVSYAQEVPPKNVAEEFGYLWVQDKGGRYEPMNTLAREVVRKITKKNTYESYTADQVLLGMIMYPASWQQKPLFKIKHPELHKIVGYKGEMVSFYDLMDASGSVYLLSDLVNEAYSKQVTLQTDLDKEVIKLDDRVNALYLAQSGGLLRIFPDTASENHKWASVSEARTGQMSEKSDTMSRVFSSYLSALQSSDYSSAQSYLKVLHNNQLTKENLLPAHSKKKMEITYNRVNLFPRLAKFYGLFGVFLLVLQFLIIFKPRKFYKTLLRVGVIHLAVAFVLHTLALAGRWYISGHAPMSNGYESMIFVAWTTLLAGLIFVKRSGFVIALTSILGALALMVAGMSNMNPEITNLVPVLKSPWLAIHVAVIMAGYGFLGIASIMGLMNVVLYAGLSPSNKVRMEDVIKQVTLVNHLTLIVGLYFMTAGVFLGGVWANESWGRYWGWDPKETWALITVLVYAFVTHMHRIPGMRGQFAFNLASFISYSSVMMTYFGVNYFLGGMHSYAGGSSFKVPVFVYIVVGVLAGLSVYAYRNQLKILPDTIEEEDQ